MSCALHRYWMRLLGRVRHPQALIYGDVSRHAGISEGVWIPYGVRVTKRSKIGRFSYVMAPCLLDNVEVGNFCSIAEGMQPIIQHHSTNQFTTFPLATRLSMHGVDFPALFEEQIDKGTIRIGHDVWIGTHCTIMGGVSIGTGAIIAAGAVVTHDVDPYTIVGGVPAKPIRKRFSASIIKHLLASHWWDWPISEIAARGKELKQMTADK